MSYRTGIGYDLHATAVGRRLVLGGVEIAHERGLLGHSDADVVLHALCDALLGAAALGDIGELFPDDDPHYKDADSRTLLADVVVRVRAAGYDVINVDMIVHAEAPKLGPHKAAIQRSIAGLLGIEANAVGVKATTNEGLGPIGRGEAIAAWASVMLRRQSAGDASGGSVVDVR